MMMVTMTMTMQAAREARAREKRRAKLAERSAERGGRASRFDFIFLFFISGYNIRRGEGAPAGLI